MEFEMEFEMKLVSSKKAIHFLKRTSNDEQNNRREEQSLKKMKILEVKVI